MFSCGFSLMIPLFYVVVLQGVCACEVFYIFFSSY